VLTDPGHTALTLIPQVAHSSARLRVRLITAALLALYPTMSGRPTFPALEATLTMAPPVPIARAAA
jgi:hypothetical protein